MATTSQAPTSMPGLYDDRRTATTAVICAIYVLAVASVCLRFYARKIQKIGYKMDDLLMIASLIAGSALFGTMLWMVRVGMGRHTQLVMMENPDNLTRLLQSLYAAQITYTFSIFFVKLSILFLYNRIFAVQGFRIYLYVLGAVVTAWATGTLLVSIFACTPVQGFWEYTMQPPPKCVDNTSSWLGNAIPNIFTDVIILALPVRMILQLKMKTSQKVSLIFIFMLGGLVTAISCVRLSQLFSFDTSDTFWSITNSGLFTLLEVEVAILSANLPTLRPVLGKIWPSQFALGSVKKSAPISNSYKLSKSGKISDFKQSLGSGDHGGFHSLNDDNNISREHILTKDNSNYEERTLPITRTMSVTHIYEDRNIPHAS